MVAYYMDGEKNISIRLWILTHDNLYHVALWSIALQLGYIDHVEF